MEETAKSAAELNCPASETSDSRGAWDVSNSATANSREPPAMKHGEKPSGDMNEKPSPPTQSLTENPWESVEPSASKHQEKPGESIKQSAPTYRENQRENAKPYALKLQAPANGWESVEPSASRHQENSWESVELSAYRNQGSSWEIAKTSAPKHLENPWDQEAVISSASKHQENPWESVEPSAHKHQQNCSGAAQPPASKQLENSWESVEASLSTRQENSWEATKQFASSSENPENSWEVIQPSAPQHQASPWDSTKPSASGHQENPWESVEPSASKHQKNSWETAKPFASRHEENQWEIEPASKRPRTDQNHPMPSGLRADLKAGARTSEKPPVESQELDVPDSAIPHIVGHAHRTLNALRNVPGITQVTIGMIKATTEQNDKKLMHRVKVEGSSVAAVTTVITQIKRIVLRSATNSINAEVSIICFREKKEGQHAISLKLITAEVYRLYLSKHLKSFVAQHAPEDVQKRKFFFCDKRITSDELTGTDNAKFINTRKRRRFYEESELPLRRTPPLMKIRIQLGKMFFFGTDLMAAPETWNMTLAEMETMTSEQTLRPCFSSHCHVDTVAKARKVLEASGYEKYKLESSQDTICAELVDMDAPKKPSFNIRFMLRDKIAAKINKKSRRLSYVTFVDDTQGHDFQMRIQSRQREPALAEKTLRLVYEAWTKRAGIEDPLISPSGHHYFPLRVLEKVFEYYKKGETEVVLTRVSPVMPGTGHEDERTDVDICRWKICFKQSFIPPCAQHADDDVGHTITRLTELVAEVKKLSEAISSETG